MMLGMMAQTPQGMSALLYYVVTYALTTLGAFAVVGVVEQQCGGDTLAHFAGLSRRSPVISFCMMVFLLSLAGIPPLAGFFGKFYIFSSALHSASGQMPMLWLVVLAIAMSAVSLYYYLQVLKRIYVENPEPASGAILVPFVSQVAICLLAAAVLLLGCVPGILLQFIHPS